MRAAAALLAVVAAVALVIVIERGSTRRPRARSGETTTQMQPALPALPAPGGQAFGVNVNRLFNDLTYTPAQIAAQLAAVRATGATLARSDALWEATEPTPPVDGRAVYDWSFDDAIAGALASAGLAWLPILDYAPPWAAADPHAAHSPPRSDAQFAAFATAFVGRYGPGGEFWRAHPSLTPQPVTAVEIWNEPDNGSFWGPAPSPAGYAALYLAARGAVDAVAPAIRVIIGGLANPPGFLIALVRAQPLLRGHVDGVAIHPYGDPPAVVAKVRATRTAMDSLGMGGVPLYITEFGWTTSPPGAPDYAPEARRPGYITATLSALGHLRCGVAASLLYTWVTPRRSVANSQDWYGIALPGNGGATPDTAAFTAGLRAASAPAPNVACGG